MTGHPEPLAVALSRLVTLQMEGRAEEMDEQEQLLHSIATFGRMSAESSRLQQDAVLTARTIGMSWARIGAALGISRQAAQQRFSAYPPQEDADESRVIGHVTRAEEVAALRTAGHQGWKLIAARHGEHTVVRTSDPWEVCRISMFALTGFPAQQAGWTVAATRFPDCFFIRPLHT
jgi:hypothetical protein